MKVDDQRIPEELASHGPGSPSAAAIDWLSALTGPGGLQAAWPLTDPDFRLAWVQDLLWHNRTHPDFAGHDLDALAAQVVQADPADPLWVEFRSILEDKLSGFPDWLLAGQYGIAADPRPLLPDYELVLLVYDPTGEGFMWQPGTFVRKQDFLTRSTADGWRVAGLEPSVPVPGWPPRFEQVA
jgi:hypothetical protein